MLDALYIDLRLFNWSALQQWYEMTHRLRIKALQKNIDIIFPPPELPNCFLRDYNLL